MNYIVLEFLESELNVSVYCRAELSDLSFRVGSSDYDKKGQVVKAKEIITHPKYTSDGWDYDIAVVKTDKPIKFGKNVKAISKLGTKKLKAGTQGWIAGWGWDSVCIFFVIVVEFGIVSV